VRSIRFRWFASFREIAARRERELFSNSYPTENACAYLSSTNERPIPAIAQESRRLERFVEPFLGRVALVGSVDVGTDRLRDIEAVWRSLLCCAERASFIRVEQLKVVGERLR